MGISIRNRIDAATYRRWLLNALFVFVVVLLIQYVYGKWAHIT
jgi:hypothetical protein